MPNGNTLRGVPPPEVMREARDLMQQRNGRLITIDDTEEDANLSAVRMALENTAEARQLRPSRGRPTDIKEMIQALDALRKGGVALRINNQATACLQDALGMTGEAARSLLRRLVNTRQRVGIANPPPGMHR
jgi:hypothetical protein